MTAPGLAMRGWPSAIRLPVLAWLRLPWSVRVCAPAVVMALLWFASSRTPERRPPDVLRDLAHNAMHVVAYGCLASGFLLAAVRRPSELRVPKPLPSVLAAVGYGIVDEVHQSFVPGRVASAADVLSDAGGALLAASAVTFVLGGRSQPRLRWSLAACGAGIAAATWLPI